MYSILFFIVIILSIILVKIIKPKFNNLLAMLLTLAIVYFIIDPELCIVSSLDGARLFVRSVLPTMFPFMAICNMIINLNGIEIYSKVLGPLLCKPLSLSNPCCFALVASFLCGYPLGAKYTTDLYKNNYISREEFIRLLNIASNIGPLFLIGAVGTSMLGNTSLGYLLLIPSYLTTIIIGLITRNKKKEDLNPPLKTMIVSNDYKSLGEIIRISIADAANNILILCGYVIIFSVIISMFKKLFLSEYFINILCKNFNISSDFITGILLGSIEVTNGCNIISNSNLNILTKLCLLAFLSSFGGLSIIAQTGAFFYTEKVSMMKYFFFKFIQGLLGIIIMFFTYIFLKNSIVMTSLSSTMFIYFNPILLILLLSLVLLIIYKLFLFS